MIDALVINLNERWADCWVCGNPTLCASGFGIPVYEDIVLPNSWDGEWFGQGACEPCFTKQGSLERPMSLDDFRNLTPLAPAMIGVE